MAQKNAYRGIGFYESLAAVLIYHATGHLSLVDYYQYGTHVRTNGVFRKLAGSEVTDVVRQTRTYCPDLLVYKVDLSDWYFVEVKGPSDSLRVNQIALFDNLLRSTGKPIYIMQFTQLD